MRALRMRVQEEDHQGRDEVREAGLDLPHIQLKGKARLRQQADPGDQAVRGCLHCAGDGRV